MTNFRNRSVDVHQFAMVPRADIPRSSFNMQTSHKSTIDFGYLTPFLCEEILPGDTFNLKSTLFARLATPLFPVMDNMYLETFFFFVPNRLVWDNWVRFMGEQDNPGDSISYVIPKITSPVGGYAKNTVYDYFGLPTVGQVDAASTVTHSALPLRAYKLIYDKWFRDQNLQSFGVAMTRGDGPDPWTNYQRYRRGKRPDYFTTALPWPQKGATAVSLPLGTSAIVKTSGSELWTGNNTGITWRRSDNSHAPNNFNMMFSQAGGRAYTFASTTAAATSGQAAYPTNLYADLSSATAATINDIRQSFQIQKFLEREARGGSRYTEIIYSQFGVKSPDARLQRPEYLGGGQTPIQINPVAQTAGTGATGTTTPLGNLAGYGTALSRHHGFTQSFTEHGYIIGLVHARADLTYQQGMRKHWSRDTRFDFFTPVFSNLGEQAVLSREIYCDGTALDTNVFGYQERWAEYRYSPPMITGLFRSTTAGTLDSWHMAQRFTSRPTLGDTFISDTPPASRVLAAGSLADGAQLYFDSFTEMRVARPMPLYSVPGLIDHF